MVVGAAPIVKCHQDNRPEPLTRNGRPSQCQRPLGDVSRGAASSS